MVVSRDPAAVRQGKERRRKWRIFAVVSIVIVASVIGAWKLRAGNGTEKDESNDVETAIAKHAAIYQKISATGIIAAQTGAQVKIGSQITGRIRRLYADIGGTVRAGQVIAQLDLPDVRAQLEQAERAYAQAREKYEAELAGSNIERTDTTSQLSQAMEALNAARVKLEQTRQIAKFSPEQTSAEIQKAEEALRGAETRVKQAQTGARLQPTQTKTQIQRANAALSTARSNLNQVQKSANLQIATAEANLKQARATLNNSLANSARITDLFKQGFASQKEVDNAKAEREVTEASVEAATENIKLVREKVAADLQAAKDSVTQNEADLDAAKSNTLLDEMKHEEVRNAEAQLRQASAALTVVKVSVYQDEIKRQDVQNVEAQVRQAEAQLSSARANLDRNILKRKQIAASMEAMKEAGARVDYWKAQWDKTFIRTPISGTVIQLAQQEGETVAAGLAAPTLIEVADLNRLEDNAYVDETDIGKVRIGQRAEIVVDAYPNQPFTGRVLKVASGMTMQQNVVTYLTTVAIDDPGGKLKPGMTTTTTIFIGGKKNVLAIPSEAVKKTEEGPIAFVWKEGMEKPDKRKLKTGSTDGTNTEIIDGLKEGESVVIAGLDKLGVEGFTQQAPSFMRRMANPFASGGEGKGKK